MTACRRWLVLACLVCLCWAPEVAAGRAGDSVMSATVDGKISLVPGPPGALPFALAVDASRPLAPPVLFRVEVRERRLSVTPAGHLPPRLLAVTLLAAPGDERPRTLLVSLRGRLGTLAARDDGTWDPADFVPFAEDSSLAVHAFPRPDLDGDGTADLVVTTWAGALLFRGRGGNRWSRLGWLPLPRFAGLGPGVVFVRARSPLAAKGHVPQRLWAMDRAAGRVLTFRGAPLTEIRPQPPSAPPPLVARVRLPRDPGGGGETIVLPGDPDRAIRLDIETTWKGTRRHPLLLVLPLIPWDEGLPAGPELSCPVPLDPGEQPPLLTVEDVDGDGTTDILLAGKPGNSKRSIAVVVFRGTGGGQFANVPLVFRGRAGKDALLLLVRDLDGDGLLDLLGAARGTLLLWKGIPPRAGTLPWDRASPVRTRLPRDTNVLPAHVRLISAEGRRWLLVRHLVPDATRTRLLAIPFPD